MTWTYTGPASSELDQVRFYLGDVDEARQFLSDEEIEFLLDSWRAAYDSPLWVASVAAEVVAGRFAAQVDVSADGASVALGQLQQRFNDLAASLRDQYKALNAINGPELQDALAQEVDWTITPLSFGVGMHDNSAAGLQDYGAYRSPTSSAFPDELAP